MKHILSFSHAYMGGGHNAGAETTLHDVMRLLRLQGYRTTALLSKPHKDGSGPYCLDGVKVQPHSSKQDPDLYFPTADVILSHLECAARSGIISRNLKKPVGHLIHNDQPYCITAAQRYADFLIYNTDWVKSAYDSCNIPGVVMHPAIDPARYSVDTDRRYITLINLSDGNEHELSYDKGPRTFYELARRFPQEEFLGVRGAYGSQLIEDLPNVTIVEHTDNILSVYRRSKVVLVPSKYESFGRVAVEAACSGIPSVVSITDGTREAMGSAGVYCAFGAHDQWEVALRSVLEDYDFYSNLVRQRSIDNWKRSQTEFENLVKLIETF